MVISNEIDEDQVDYDDNHIYDDPYQGQNQIPNTDLTQQNLPESAVKWQEITLEIQQKNNDVRWNKYIEAQKSILPQFNKALYNFIIYCS